MGLMMALTIAVNSSKSDQSEVEGCSSLSICNIIFNIEYAGIIIFIIAIAMHCTKFEVALDKWKSKFLSIPTEYCLLRIAEGEGSAAVERTGARSEQSWKTVKRDTTKYP